MTQFTNLLTITVRSAGAVSRYRAVGFNGAQATVAGQKVVGVAMMKALAAGEDLAIIACGTAIVETGAAFAQGVGLTVDSSGRAVAASALAIAAGATAVTSAAANGATTITGSEPPQFCFADALTAATAAGQFVEVLLRR